MASLQEMVRGVGLGDVGVGVGGVGMGVSVGRIGVTVEGVHPQTPMPNTRRIRPATNKDFCIRYFPLVVCSLTRFSITVEKESRRHTVVTPGILIGPLGTTLRAT
jgi:hypothetical protein